MTGRALFFGGMLAAFACACSTNDALPAPPAEPDAPVDELFTTSADCPPGTRPAIGADTCVPVGTTVCAPGFERDPSGWGCAPVLPAEDCAGATRPSLGSSACVPVGDCDAAFPPPNAIVVDPALADPQVDATHVRTVSDGAAVAADGATLALVDGTHSLEGLRLTKKLAIVGRCAARTKLVPATPTSVGILSVTDLAVRGLTFEGVEIPIESYGRAASIDVEDVVLEKSKARAVFIRGGRAHFREVVVRGTVARTPGAQTVAVLAESNANVTLDDCAVIDSFDAAGAAVDAGTTIAMNRTVVRKTSSAAVRAFEGAHVDIVESAILDSGLTGVLSLHRETGVPEITLTRSVIRNTHAGMTSGAGAPTGTAVSAGGGAIVKLEETTIRDTEGIGLWADGARVTASNSAIVGLRKGATTGSWSAVALGGGEIAFVSTASVSPQTPGLEADAGKLTVERSLIRHGEAVVEPDLFGVGIFASSRSTVTVTDTTVADAADLGIVVGEHGTNASLDRVLVTRRPGPGQSSYGHGIVATEYATFRISRSIVQHQAGIGVSALGGSGIVSASLVRSNAIAMHVQSGAGARRHQRRPFRRQRHESRLERDSRPDDRRILIRRLVDTDVPSH